MGRDTGQARMQFIGIQTPGGLRIAGASILHSASMFTVCFRRHVGQANRHADNMSGCDCLFSSIVNINRSGGLFDGVDHRATASILR